MTKNTQPPAPLGRLIAFFASVKLSIALLLTLAGTSIVGTVIPQGQSPDFYQHQFGAAGQRLMAALNLTDMYHSWWFQALLILLAANLVVCSLRRLPSTWKVVRARPSGFNMGRFSGIKEKEEFETRANADALAPLVEKTLSRGFGRVRTEKLSQGFGLWAERGRWTRLGPYLIHAGFLLVLAGGVVGSLYGFNGFVNLPEGDSVEQVASRDTGEMVPLPFAMRCDKFSVQFYDNNMPKSYTSTLTVLEKGSKVFTRDIQVNHPLRYKGINVFQSSYGQDVSANLEFTEAETGMIYNLHAASRENVEMPNGAGHFAIMDFEPSFSHQGMDLGAVFRLAVYPKDAEPLQLSVFADRPDLNRMRQAGPFFVSVKDWKKTWYTGLEVTRDPGVGLVYAGFIFIITGCFVTFFLLHGQVFILVTGGKRKTRVAVAGVANKNQQGFGIRVHRLADSLSAVASGLEERENR